MNGLSDAQTPIIKPGAAELAATLADVLDAIKNAPPAYKQMVDEHKALQATRDDHADILAANEKLMKEHQASLVIFNKQQSDDAKERQDHRRDMEARERALSVKDIALGQRDKLVTGREKSADQREKEQDARKAKQDSFDASMQKREDDVKKAWENVAKLQDEIKGQKDRIEAAIRGDK